MNSLLRGQRVVVVFSGGQDSTTCLYYAKTAGCEIHAITFNYNQRHAIEVEAAKRIAKMAQVVSHEIVSLGPILKGTSPLVSQEPLEQYSDFRSLPGGLENTFVPMRNQLFLTIAANRAFVYRCNTLITGVSAEDFGGYPDCRREFIESFEQTSTFGTFTENGLYIDTPLMWLTKAASIHLANRLPGCYEALAYSHTSYDGKYPPTGHDHATLLRAKGFEEADVPDPLILRANLEGLMTLPRTPNYRDERLRFYQPRIELTLHA